MHLNNTGSIEYLAPMIAGSSIIVITFLIIVFLIIFSIYFKKS